MEIKIDKALLSVEQYESLSKLDETMRSTIINLCSNPRGAGIQVEYGTALVAGQSGDTFKLTQNASFELGYSYVIVDTVKTILTSYFSENKVDDALLLVSLIFSQKSNSCSEKEVSAKESEEEPKEVDSSSHPYVPVDPRYTFDKIVLPERVRTELMNAVKLIEHRDLIFNEWGYGEVEPFARCVINMYGPAGTGKTMCAHAIAAHVGKKLLALNYSEIESKYLGEAAKNLATAFDTAKDLDAVVFFDEADSFLGKRVKNVTQSSDQALNSLRSQMLILLEKFDGIVIFATNLVSNFDEAFMSRIQKHIKFELPDAPQIAEILKKQIPSKLPLSQEITHEEFEEIAQNGVSLSGREIKNAIFELLLEKAGEEEVAFTPEDFSRALSSKVESIKHIEEEKNKLLKERIMKKMAQKVQEDSLSKMESEN